MITAIVPQELLLAFLAAGAFAIICFAPDTEASISPEGLVGYFKRLYTALLTDELSLTAALSAASKFGLACCLMVLAATIDAPCASLHCLSCTLC